MSSNRIRNALRTDAAELARLTSALGYPASVEIVHTRLSRLLDSQMDQVLVAEGTEGKLAGWIHGFCSQLLESDFRVEIGGLFVDESYRRKGVGRDLVLSLEQWTSNKGAQELSVRCREERFDAHLFYQSLNFQLTKTQRVFRKRIKGHR